MTNLSPEVWPLPLSFQPEAPCLWVFPLAGEPLGPLSRLPLCTARCSLKALGEPSVGLAALPMQLLSGLSALQT